MQPSAPLRGGELTGMEPAPGMQGRAGVAERPMDTDAVEGDLCWGDGERLPADGQSGSRAVARSASVISSRARSRVPAWAALYAQVPSICA